MVLSVVLWSNLNIFCGTKLEQISTVPPAIPPLANEFIKLDGASNVTLPCNGTGDPSPVVIWMRGSVVLTIPGERYLQEPGRV